MGEQEPFGMPSEHRIAGGTRPRAAEKAGLPIGRRASMLAHQPGEPHDRALPASRGRFRKALDQIAKNCRARRTVKEHYFLHGKGSAKDDLIDDVRHGRPTRLDTQLDMEVQIRPLVGETGQRMNQGVRPTERPLPQGTDGATGSARQCASRSRGRPPLVSIPR